MRRILIAAVPLLAGVLAVPAQGQISARVHIDIPIGRQSPVYQGQRRQVVVREYDSRRFGAWDGYYDQWVPETVYYYDGYYYDYPIVAYAQPIIVFRFRNEIFFAPRQREFIVWRDRYRPQNYRRDNGRDDRRDDRWDNNHSRPDPRDDHNGRQYQQPRNGNDGRDGRDDRDGRGGRQAQPQQNGRDNRDARPAQPQAGRDHGSARPGGSGRSGGQGRDAGRARPGGH